MASDLEFVEFVVEQIGDQCDITYKKMFGEYGIWSKGKIVALVCDNRLFIKPTEAGRAFIGDVVEAPPYPGAKNSFLIEEKIEDRDWLTELVTMTEAELPAPKPQKKRKKKKKKVKKRTAAKKSRTK
jgi:TfoX/Sxy family transcriptional regulator of competence genes